MDLYPKTGLFLHVKQLPMYVHVCVQLETVGDCYIVVGGLMHTDEDGYTSVREDVDPLHAVSVMRFAKVLLIQSRACPKLEYDWNDFDAEQCRVHFSNREGTFSGRSSNREGTLSA